jgi:glyoxylase-like metal-dependent hydrolase (beta-lactamase superfamily II)
MTEATEELPAPSVDPGGLTEIADAVWLIPDRRVPLVPNVGIVLGDEAALVVDTAMGPANGRLVLEAARSLAGPRRLLLTVTHFHPEHGFGAQAFAGVAHSVYNRAQLDELRDKGDGYLTMFRTFAPTVEQALDGVELVEPDETYSGTSSLDLGGRSVLLRETGLAHTRGDQVVVVDDAGVLFTGDLVEQGCFPIFPYFPPDDVDVDGSAWIDVLAGLEELGAEVVVPGHGAAGGVEVIATQRAFMEELRSASYRAADEGRSADEAVAELEAGLQALHPDWTQPEWVGFGIRCFHAERVGG